MTGLSDLVDQFSKIDIGIDNDDPDIPDCNHDLIDLTDPERPYCYQCGISFDGFGNPMEGLGRSIVFFGWLGQMDCFCSIGGY
jgi:hypothetical protein